MRLGQVMLSHRHMERASVREMARRIGVNHTSLSRFERGMPINANTFIRLWTWLIEKDVAA